ncbi:MAG: DUF2071 domain-containing protein [Verrucomicrobia bacterium]|nr:DUF2071 domain-containing protein [Verrucomicrobiota bacterium]
MNHKFPGAGTTTLSSNATSARMGDSPCGCTLSGLARQRFLAAEGKPAFLCEWPRALFVHYKLDPAALQPQVPFALELFEGKAIVSLAAFTMRRFRPRRSGKFGEWLFRPAATNHFFNVRAYVHHGGEPGVYFISQWLSHPLCLLGRLPGLQLPWHLGRMRYAHSHEVGRLTGHVLGVLGGSLNYRAVLPSDARFAAASPGSLAEFATERYTAFALRGSREVVFRVWHEPWPQCPVEAEVKDAGLLQQSGDWHYGAQLAAANYAIGCREVWMGRVRAIPRPGGPKSQLSRSVSSAFYEMP